MRAILVLALAGTLATFPSTAHGAFACPVTIPNGSPPPPGGGSLAPGSLSTHGNGLLWTILPDDGVWRVPEAGMRPDGSIEQKFVWWRRPIEQTVQAVGGVVTVETTFAGDLEITGIRLDAVSEPLTATTMPEGVHVGSTIDFSSGGCWQITGTAGADSLTFTVYMLAPGEPLPNTALPSGLPWTGLGVVVLLAAAWALGRRLLRPD